MKDFKDLTPEELNKMDKEVLITIISSLQGQLKSISHQLDFLTEQIALMNQRSFGKKTEQADYMQLTIFDSALNEAEFKCDNSPEPEIDEIIVSSYTRGKKTKREEKLKDIPARVHEHKFSEEELKELFPYGYKELPVETYKRLSIIPQTFIVDEHHVHVYASKNNDGTIIRASRPADLFRNSIATAELVSAIMTSKYLNHLPLERQIASFKDSGVKLESNTLANWMIKASDKYLSLIYDELHKCLYESNVLHADETPFKVIKPNGDDSKQKSYMWVYRNSPEHKRPVVIYDYRPGRNHFYPSEFLKDYSGILVTDGYQAYHSLDNKRDDIKVAGCWVHTKRKFADLVKAVGEDNVSGTISAQAIEKISEIFHMDKELKGLTIAKRKKQRQRLIKPKVDDFFDWLNEQLPTLPSESNTAKAISYCLNQEKYLRVFLSNGNIPMDNNAAERAIRPFTIGRKNWVNIFSENGAEASSVIYSIVETAKANDIRVYDYLTLLLQEMSTHAKDEDTSYIENLMPWSDYVKEKCKNPKKTDINISMS